MGTNTIHKHYTALDYGQPPKILRIHLIVTGIILNLDHEVSIIVRQWRNALNLSTSFLLFSCSKRKERLSKVKKSLFVC